MTMTKMTITEALAEIATIAKRITKKQQFVGDYLGRQKMLMDPLAKEGGSFQRLQQERQAITDLQERIVSARGAIMRANMETKVTIGGVTRVLQDWLSWKREVAPVLQAFLGGIRKQLQQVRQQAMTKGVAIVQATAGENAQDKDVIINISEDELAKEIEKLEEILGTLDGQLSLKNATTMIEF